MITLNFFLVFFLAFEGILSGGPSFSDSHFSCLTTLDSCDVECKALLETKKKLQQFEDSQRVINKDIEMQEFQINITKRNLMESLKTVEKGSDYEKFLLNIIIEDEQTAESMRDQLARSELNITQAQNAFNKALKKHKECSNCMKKPLVRATSLCDE